MESQCRQDECQTDQMENIPTVSTQDQEDKMEQKSEHLGAECSGPKEKWDLVMENYSLQRKIWPTSGRHILAHFDEESVVVYQAFKPSIAEFAVKNQRFGGPHYSFDRMSWVKTNFMWMMYRCGWAMKIGQERVLAVRITRAGFEDILSKALTMEKQKALKIQTKDIEVRLQWDPDHSPCGGNLTRRAIQLGLKGKTLLNFTSKYIMNIKDITEFVHEQHQLLQDNGEHAISSPRERIYMPSSHKTCGQINLDFAPQQTVVSFGP